MAKGRKTGGRDFKVGHKMAKGGAAHNPDLKRIRKLTQSEVAEIGSMILELNLKQLIDIKTETGAKALKVWIASIVARAISKGDAQALNALLDRIVGKVKDKIEMSGPDGGPIAVESNSWVKRALSDPETLEAAMLIAQKMDDESKP